MEAAKSAMTLPEQLDIIKRALRHSDTQYAERPKAITALAALRETVAGLQTAASETWELLEGQTAIRMRAEATLKSQGARIAELERCLEKSAKRAAGFYDAWGATIAAARLKCKRAISAEERLTKLEAALRETRKEICNIHRYVDRGARPEALTCIGMAMTVVDAVLALTELREDTQKCLAPKCLKPSRPLTQNSLGGKCLNV